MVETRAEIEDKIFRAKRKNEARGSDKSRPNRIFNDDKSISGVFNATLRLPAIAWTLNVLRLPNPRPLSLVGLGRLENDERLFIISSSATITAAQTRVEEPFASETTA